ncbi:hypothetical protein [Curtobacterium sp. MCBA15_004]|uniref:hypothetical protein n=1 Tax=Curtobacterium sp. MCBA15_004 TaxID=1898733 RepID=UPI0008DD660E|nr:hypothetical protein [Curtobacterium sp. MCBA15_004]WIA96451.1 hypothetical protein QOL16_15335 [Curtobacterium sp. MCBA15_004]
MTDNIAAAEAAAPVLPQGRLLYTTRTLAEAIDRSTQYVRTDVRNGHLVGKRENEKSSYFFTPEEAERYARWLASGRPAA